MSNYRTVDGDRLDLICWRHYGSLDGRIVEQVLEANKGLAADTVLPSGVDITLPDIMPETLEASLW